MKTKEIDEDGFEAKLLVQEPIDTGLKDCAGGCGKKLKIPEGEVRPSYCWSCLKNQSK